MKYYNTTKLRLCVTAETIFPQSTSLEYSEKDIDTDKELRFFIGSGALIPYTGKEKVANATAPKVDQRYIKDSPKKDVHVKNEKTGEISYIIADSESSDMIYNSDPDMVIAKNSDPDAPAPIDYIEDGYDAHAGKPVSQVLEDQLNKDNELSSFDDEDSLADNEGEDSDVEDVDDFMAKEASRFLKANGKAGGKVTTVKAEMGNDMALVIDEMNQAASVGSDDYEDVAASDPKVVDFLKQPLMAKKKAISKTTDPAFLKEVGKASTSANIKNLVSQRMKELG